MKKIWIASARAINNIEKHAFRILHSGGWYLSKKCSPGHRCSINIATFSSSFNQDVNCLIAGSTFIRPSTREPLLSSKPRCVRWNSWYHHFLNNFPPTGACVKMFGWIQGRGKAQWICGIQVRVEHLKTKIQLYSIGLTICHVGTNEEWSTGYKSRMQCPTWKKLSDFTSPTWPL